MKVRLTCAVVAAACFAVAPIAAGRSAPTLIIALCVLLGIANGIYATRPEKHYP